MKRRIPPEAFDVYVAMGIERSYQAVASHFGVSKAAVTNLATREKWQDRLQAAERKARQGSDERAAETLQQISERHLKAARVVQAKALEALRSMSLESAMEAVRALDLGLKQERLIVGEPTERSANVEEIIKREYERWLEPSNGGERD